LKIPAALRRFFCSHAVVTLSTIGPALVTSGKVVIPGVEITCARCGEFWHAELDASAAVNAGLETR